MKVILGGDTDDIDILDWIKSWVTDAGHIDVHNKKGIYDVRGVCNLIKGGIVDKGILISDLGVDVAILANREGESIRAVACFDLFTLHKSLELYRVNVLCIGLEVLGPGISKALVNSFLECD